MGSKTTEAFKDSTQDRQRRGAIITFCAAYLALQVLVPLTLLPNPANKPFGWQMYSAVSGHRYEVRFEDGTTKVVDPSDYVLRYRSEVDYRKYLPKLLCDRLPEASSITASNALAKTSESHKCER